MKTLMLLAVGGLALAGCNTTDTCAGIHDAHKEFLAEVAANPGTFSPEFIEDERRGYLAARLTCAAFVKKSPVAE